MGQHAPGWLVLALDYGFGPWPLGDVFRPNVVITALDARTRGEFVHDIFSGSDQFGGREVTFGELVHFQNLMPLHLVVGLPRISICNRVY